MRAVVAFVWAALAAGAIAAGAGAVPRHATNISGCVYVTNKGLVSVLNLVISDNDAPNARGTVDFSGAGLNEKMPFRLSASGLGRIPFTVTTFNSYRFDVKLAKPKASYRVEFTMSPANDLTTPSCIPK